MFIEDIEVGMQVVPVSRTASRNSWSADMHPPTHSVTWRKALQAGQPFLIVAKVDYREERILCSIDGSEGGDYFKEYDLEPYP